METWKDRLRAAIETSGRSKRDIGMKIRLGENYVSQMLNSDSDPLISNILAVTAEIGVSPSYIIGGVKMTPDVEQLILKYQSFPEDLRDETMQLFDRYEEIARLRKLADVDPPAE